jgi:hypothetical protein
MGHDEDFLHQVVQVRRADAEPHEEPGDERGMCPKKRFCTDGFGDLHFCRGSHVLLC